MNCSKVAIRHGNVTSGDRCAECTRGRAYTQQKAKTLVRIVRRAPVKATVYEMERLRCNASGQVFTAEEPEGIGGDKCDATAAAIVPQLKYGPACRSPGWNGWSSRLGFHYLHPHSGS